MSIVPAAESVQVSPDSWAGPCPSPALVANVLRITAAVCSINLHYINGDRRPCQDCVRGAFSRRVDLEFTIFCCDFYFFLNIRLHGTGSNTHVYRRVSFCTHVTLPIIQWELKLIHAVPATPSYQCLQGHRASCFFIYMFLFCSSPQVPLLNPRPLAL